MLAASGARHARSMRAYGLAAAVLVAVGLALAVLGWLLPERHGFALITVGVLACGLAVLPALEALERRERVEGLSVLADEWAELERTGDDPEATRRELRLFLRRLYDKKAAGPSDVQ